MSKKEDFYIGWQENMPASNSSFLRKRLIPLFVGIPILVFLFVFFQKPYNAHFFEFGNVKEITGTYFHSPFPVLVADAGTLPENLAKEILLVGYGKFGAKGIMETIQANNENLHGKKITLSGTLIHGDNKTLMELTNEANSLIRIDDGKARPAERTLAPTAITVQGEILDPKCYFGVMKPAIGKIHKSCAIRCISGGIPPVFRNETGDAQRPYDYYLMVDKNGKTINQHVLPFVAEQVSLEGTTNAINNWKILYVDIGQLEMN